VKLVKMSPSRGFAIELGAATVIVLGSRYGIPLSTTHCQVGATVGVGLTEGKKGVNMILLIKVIIGWVITLVVVGFTTAAFFAQGAYAPSIPNLRYVDRYSEGVEKVSLDMAEFLNGTDVENLENLGKTTTDGFRNLEENRSDLSDEHIKLLDDAWQAIRGFCSA